MKGFPIFSKIAQKPSIYRRLHALREYPFKCTEVNFWTEAVITLFRVADEIYLPESRHLIWNIWDKFEFCNCVSNAAIGTTKMCLKIELT